MRFRRICRDLATVRKIVSLVLRLLPAVTANLLIDSTSANKTLGSSASAEFYRLSVENRG